MTAREGTFRGTNGAELFYRVSMPNTAPKAVVIALHGLGDHSGGLQNLIERLNDSGYITYAFDLRGHGKSSGNRGYIRKWEEYRSDFHSFRKLASSEQPHLPLYIVAHSLGGVISLDYVLQNDAGIAGLVAIAPAVSYEFKLSEKLLVALMGILKPDYTVNNPSNLELLTRDPVIQGRLKSDDLRHNSKTPGLGRGLMYTVPLILKKAQSLRIPFLLQYGLDDSVTPPLKLRRFFDSVGSSNKQTFEYEGMRHRPFDELEREPFFDDMMGWLDRNTEGAKRASDPHEVN